MNENLCTKEEGITLSNCETKLQTIHGMKVDIDKERPKLNYSIFKINNIEFKQETNVDFLEGTILGREKYKNFQFEIGKIVNRRVNFIFDDVFNCIKNQNVDYVLFNEFEKVVYELVKKEETKEIILKYFDISDIS